MSVAALSRLPAAGAVADWRERTHVTVLFLDIQNSMALSDAVGLEDWWEILSEVVGLMYEGVHRFDGEVAAFTGDGVKAVFTASDAGLPHAARACAAALWLQDVLRATGEDVGRRHGIDLAVRSGIHTGEVITGKIGGRHDQCHTATGYTVALAKRVEALASPGGISLTESTARLLPPWFRCRCAGAFPVKGAAAPVTVYELLGCVADD